MLNLCGIVVAILKMEIGRNFSMSGINSGLWNRTMLNLCGIVAAITAQIQHCPISMPFHMWVDYDVLNWFLTSKNFYRSPFSKWPPQYHTNSTLSDFNDFSYVGRLWCPELIPDIENFLRTMLNFCGIVAAILKMVTGRNFSMSGHHYLPTYQILMISDNVEFLPPIFYAVYIEKFLPVAIFKMVATIPHKFSTVQFQCHFICG
jgi:hypothetical protein